MTLEDSMERHQFDRLTRACFPRIPRRTVVGALIAEACVLSTLAGGAAKGKKKKKVTLCLNGQTFSVKKTKLKRQLAGGATRGACPPGPTRQTVMRTFANTGQIAIPATTNGAGAANPYPVIIEVSGFVNGRISDVDLTLKDFRHADMDNVEIMLVKENTNAVVLGDVSRDVTIPAVTVTLDDEASMPLPETTAFTSGRFQPRDYDVADGPIVFTAPAPRPTGNSALSTFDGLDPNGDWRLFVVDDIFAIDGAISGGWELTITAEVDV